METMRTPKATSPVRGALTYFMGALTILTCPCHLPILLVLLSGTAAGAFLSANLGMAILILLPVFLICAFSTWRLLDTGKRQPETEEACGPCGVDSRYTPRLLRRAHGSGESSGAVRTDRDL